MQRLTARLFDDDHNLIDTIHGTPNRIATRIAGFAEGMAFEGEGFTVEFVTKQED